MFNQILVPLDRSPLAECVLPHAIALARSLDAQLLLLHVLSVPDKQDGLRAVDSLGWQLLRAEAESYLHGVCARMKEAGVGCTVQISEGDAAGQGEDTRRRRRSARPQPRVRSAGLRALRLGLDRLRPSRARSLQAR